MPVQPHQSPGHRTRRRQVHDVPVSDPAGGTAVAPRRTETGRKRAATVPTCADHVRSSSFPAENPVERHPELPAALKANPRLWSFTRHGPGRSRRDAICRWAPTCGQALRVTSAGGPLHAQIGGSVSEAVCKPSSVPDALRRRGDGHPSGAAGRPTAHAADPRAGQRTSPPRRLPVDGLRPPIWPCSGWSLPVSLRSAACAAVRHRHCGTGPRLTAGGRYPPPCAAELGLSSRRRRVTPP